MIVAACSPLLKIADDILDCTQTSEQLGKTAGKDKDFDKTTYVKLLGIKGAKKEARRLLDKATAALIPFRERNIPLLAMANYIVDRSL